jgi:hypothetical protein
VTNHMVWLQSYRRAAHENDAARGPWVFSSPTSGVPRARSWFGEKNVVPVHGSEKKTWWPFEPYAAPHLLFVLVLGCSS